METSPPTLSFARVSGKKVEADFDGGFTTHDGGLLLLRKAEAHTGVLKRMVAAFPDRRHPSYIDHTAAQISSLPGEFHSFGWTSQRPSP